MQEVKLDPHQRKAVNELHNGSILCGGVGVGKSRVAMRYYVEKEAPKNVIVITTAKKRDSLDWVAEGVAQGVGTAPDATFHGVLTVDSWNNLWRYVDVEDAFFIFDEQRLVGSGAWVKVFQKIAKKNHWILLSATPGDTWLDYIPVFVANGLYPNRTAFLREHVVYSRYSKFPKVERYIGVGRLVRHRNNLLVDMPYQRHTTRVIKDVLVEHDEELFEKVVKKRWHPYENRPLRDVSELYSVMRKVANGDASRLAAVRTLITQHPKLIVFYNFDYELEILRTLGEEATTNLEEECKTNMSLTSKTLSLSGLKEVSPPSSETLSTSSSRCLEGLESVSECPIKDCIDCKQLEMSSTELSGTTKKPFKQLTDGLQSAGALYEKNRKVSSTETETSSSWKPTIQVAEWNGHKHEPIPKTDRWVYLVQYTAGAEGWNCIETDTVVFYSLNYSYRIFEQCQGRIDRLNTPFTQLNYYVFKSKSAIDAMIWKALKSKQNFNEKRNEKVLAEMAS